MTRQTRRPLQSCEWDNIKVLIDVIGWVFHHGSTATFKSFHEELDEFLKGYMLEGVHVSIYRFSNSPGQDLGDRLGGTNLLRIELRTNSADLNPATSAQWAFGMDKDGKSGFILIGVKMTEEDFTKIKFSTDPSKLN